MAAALEDVPPHLLQGLVPEGLWESQQHQGAEQKSHIRGSLDGDKVSTLSEHLRLSSSL